MYRGLSLEPKSQKRPQGLHSKNREMPKERKNRKLQRGPRTWSQGPAPLSLSRASFPPTAHAHSPTACCPPRLPVTVSASASGLQIFGLVETSPATNGVAKTFLKTGSSSSRNEARQEKERSTTQGAVKRLEQRPVPLDLGHLGGTAPYPL